MSNHCRIEFYFKRKDMEELLAANPRAKGIIVRQEIKPRKKAGVGSFENVVIITAFTKSSSAVEEFRPRGIKASITGCPNPPGCEKETPDEI